MKTTQKNFYLFKQECQKWIDRFELNNYRVVYEWKDLKKSDASMNSQQSSMNSTIALSKNIGFDGADYNMSQNEFIKSLAKHEIIHLLLGRYVWCAESRFIITNEISESEEELVRKLEKIIK